MHVACAPALARAWNQARLDTQAPDAYTAPCLEELFARFEEPTPEARWHRPLFVVTATGAPGAIDAAPTPCAALWEALTQGNAQAPKGVTAPTRRTTNNSMELLDTVTQQVIAALLAQRSMGTESGTFPLLLAAMPPVSFTMPPGRTFPTPARLQTLRRQFVRIYASKAESDGLALTGNDARPNLAKLFAGWLQEALA
ncbi:hypothetical protein MVES_001811 [Malassezia vespertilionis]|uniref:Uncharacterized protein n=2 Tax=Malassezia vespertilionis TaxID=2020962 RepID=A0A2N1JCY8_9BASI|nr:hypothetical protein MVES_001811 [Malassezia vespertilionis]